MEDIILCKKCKKELKKEDMISVKGIGKVHIECRRKQLVDKYNKEHADKEINILIAQKKEKEKIEMEKQKEKELKMLKQKEKDTQKQNELKVIAQKKEDRKLFLNYIIEIYNITLPSYTIIKINNVNNGSLEGLKEPISCEDLLHMFKSKQKELVGIYQNNIKKGNKFKDNVQRFHYDLAIIIGKYNSYKKWKENQKTKSITTNDINKIDDNTKILNISTQPTQPTQQNNNGNEIADILDELF